MSVDDVTLGHGCSVGIDDPEERSEHRLASDVTVELNAPLAWIRPRRIAIHLRRISGGKAKTQTFNKHKASNVHRNPSKDMGNRLWPAT